MSFPSLRVRAIPRMQLPLVAFPRVAIAWLVRPSARHIALSGVAVAAAGFGLTLVIWANEGFAPLRASAMVGPVALAAEAVLAVAYTAVGYLLGARQSRNAIGWLFLAVGVSGAMTLPGNFLVAGLHNSIRVSPGHAVAWAWVTSSFHLPLVAALMTAVIVLFPDGRPRSRLATFALPLAAAGATIVALGLAVDPSGLLWFPALPNPLAAPRDIATPIVSARGVGLAMLLLAVAIATGSMVLRYRSSTIAQRQALRWMASAMGLLVATGVPFLVVRYGVRTPAGTAELMLVATLIAATLLPAAAAVGMMRHRLFEVDLIVNRTLVYVPVMAILSGLYAASVAFFQRVFITLTGDTSDIAIVITTLVLASAFTPIRKAVEGVVERRWKPESPAEPTGTTGPGTEASHAGAASAATGWPEPTAFDRGIAERLAALESRLAAVEGGTGVRAGATRQTIR